MLDDCQSRPVRSRAPIVGLVGLAARVEPHVKAAIEKVAAAQNRSVSYVVTQVMTEWLEANGHLPSGYAKR